MIYCDELLAVAKRIFWFGTPEETLEFPKRFPTYASDGDIDILRKYFTDDAFKAILDDPAPGIFDRSSWAKWNERYKRTPVPPLPGRKIPGVDPATIPDFFPPQVLKTSAKFTDCFCHSSPQFLAPAFSHSVYPASGSQAYFLVLVVLDSQVGPALQLPPLLFPSTLPHREVYPVFPSYSRRLASLRFCCVRGSREKRDSSSVSLPLPALPKSL
jgi:hypothetical protein